MELNIATVLREIAARHPDRDALLTGTTQRSWRELDERTDRFAAALVAHGLGALDVDDEAPGWVQRNDHVALYLLNGPEYLESMVGAWKARAASVNVNYRYVADELCYLFDDSHARAVVFHSRFAATLRDVLGRLDAAPTLILQVPDDSGEALLDGAQWYDDALDAADVSVLRPVSPQLSGDDTYVCYTGGTTGPPKGTLWRQGDFVVAALGVRRRDGAEHDSLASVLELAKGTVRALPAPPLMHGAAHWNALSCWIAGGTVIIQDEPSRFDPADVLDSAERHGATSLLIVGDPMGRPLVDELRHGRQRSLDSLRHLLSGGAVLSPTLKEELLTLLPGITVVDVLGSTESGRQGVARSAARSAAGARFERSTDAVVLSEDRERVLSPGEPELGWLAQAGRVPLGYLRDPDKTAQTFPVVDGVRHAVPGDRARLLDDGSIELHGRESVCINTGGEKVFAEEVETAIKQHPGVFDAVVCGRPSPRWGQEVVAVVQLRQGADVSDDELVSTVRRHLAGYKAPRAIVRRDHIVRSPSGKADYRWARAQVTHEQTEDSGTADADTAGERS